MTGAAMPQIDYGSRLRAGVLVPSGNSVAEPEIRAILPPEVSMLVTRLALRGLHRDKICSRDLPARAGIKLACPDKQSVHGLAFAAIERHRQ